MLGAAAHVVERFDRRRSLDRRREQLAVVIDRNGPDDRGVGRARGALSAGANG
jgi:hypothetical protein